MSTYDVPIPFRRIHDGPLDNSLVFTSTTDLNNYLTDATRYAGQLVSLVEAGETKVYVLSADTHSWQLLKITNDVVSVNAKTGIVVLNPDDLDDTSSTNKFVSQAEKDNIHVHSNHAVLDGTEESFTTEILNQLQNLDTVIDGGTF